MKYTPEEIAELLKERPNQPHYIAALVRRAVKEEREVCEKVCEDLGEFYCAQAIRARGEVPR
jgi:hypothetical protein